jgi:hypothetical protein
MRRSPLYIIQWARGAERLWPWQPPAPRCTILRTATGRNTRRGEAPLERGRGSLRILHPKWLGWCFMAFIDVFCPRPGLHRRHRCMPAPGQFLPPIHSPDLAWAKSTFLPKDSETVGRNCARRGDWATALAFLTSAESQAVRKAAVADRRVPTRRRRKPKWATCGGVPIKPTA